MPWLHALQHWVAVHTGTSNETSPWYAWWSGFGSDIGEITIIGACVGVYRAHNCHTKGCWRIARHEVTGTPYRVCRKCHPTIPDQVTRAQIHAAFDRPRTGPPEPEDATDGVGGPTSCRTDPEVST